MYLTLEDFKGMYFDDMCLRCIKLYTKCLEKGDDVDKIIEMLYKNVYMRNYDFNELRILIKHYDEWVSQIDTIRTINNS